MDLNAEIGLLCTLMHPIFRNADIWREVFGHLHADSHGRKPNPALLQCALACKSFSDCALDYLWRDMRDIEPLLKVLQPPSDSVTQSAVSTSSQLATTALISSLEPEKYNRFHFYARRVRSFDLKIYMMHAPRVALFGTLSLLAQGQPLFISLQTLRWTQYGHNDAIYKDFLAFLSPSLHTLAIDHYKLEATDPYFSLAICHLTMFCPLLRFFSLTCRPLNQGHGLPLVRSLSSCKHLKKLHINSPILEFLSTPHLAEVDLLTSLKLTLPDDATSMPPSSLIQSYQKVSRLFLQRGTLRSLERVLPSLGSYKKLRRLHIDGTRCQGDMTPHLRNVLLELSNYSKAAPLQDLRIRLAAESSFDPKGRYVEILAPILRLHTLESVNLALSLRSVLCTDDDLVTIAKSLPRLTSLTFEYAGAPSLASLVNVAQGCPNLITLKLTRLDMSTLSMDLNVIPSLSHPLKNFNILSGGEVAMDRWRAACVIDRLFPNTKVSSLQDNNQPTMQEFLRGLRASQAQTRAQACQHPGHAT